LEKAGYEVTIAKDGSGVTEVAGQCQHDLILLDVAMPGQDGLAVCRALQSQEVTSEIPVICVTAASDAEQVLQAFSAGGCDIITKPFTTQEVLARVGAHVRLRQAEAELRLKSGELEEVNKELANVSRLDPLTRLLNRRAWDETVVQEHERFLRHGHPYSVVMIDVDHFKAYNASCGHQAGDECLCRIADAISGVCRRVDFVGRYGGEEFVVLAPETDAESAAKLADRIRRAIWGLAIPHPARNNHARITASLGIAVSLADQTLWEDVLRRADDALYVAKRAGRNMVYTDNGQGRKRRTAYAATSSTDSSESDPEGEGHRLNVLVVDDDATNRAVCKGCLERAGYQVYEAADGRIALAQVGEKVPDVVVMDIMMPNMDGLECTRALRADPDTRDIPIIIVSALARPEDILSGLEAGADEYLSKPIRSSELVLRVQSMARLHRDRMDLLMSYEERGKQMRILSRLVEFCRAVSNSQTSNEILEHTVAAVADVTDCRRVSIMLPDESRQFLNVVSSLGVDEAVIRAVKVPLGEPIAGRVFTAGEAVVVNTEAEAHTCSGDYDAPFFASVPLVSAPLDAAGRVVGVLNATEKEGCLPFESRDLEYVELISKVTGTAIHDMHMREARDQASDSIMVGLAKLAEYRDNDTGRHLDRVTQFCLMLARTLRKKGAFRKQIDQDFLHNLERSVPLHDIGKVAIPDEILLFPGKLSEEQMSIMRTHTVAGANTIQSLIDKAPGVCFLEMAMTIARYHHERWDGLGYPAGLSGADIPLAARITAVADVYDALTTRRVYKEAFSHEKAASIILEGSGTQFDPDVVEAFRLRENDFAGLAETMADEPQTGAESNRKVTLDVS
jgi:putative two-component system response regulator